MQRRVLPFLVLGAVLCMSLTAQASTSFVAGFHILPNVPGLYPIQIKAFGTDNLQGVNLSLLTGTNGGDATASIPDAPTLNSVSVVSAGTLFNTNNNTESIGFAGSNVWQGGTATLAGFLVGGADAFGNVVANVIIDTTGFGPGVYPLSVSGGLGGLLTPSDWGGSSVPTWTDGTISIVPEPSSVVFGLFAIAGLGAVAIRRRRSRKAA